MSEPEATRVTKPRGSMDMDASIWSELPFEMVGYVLSFLLLPDVCRNCTVCKKWNQLIRSAKFAALHGQHARRRRGPSFIVMNLWHRGPAIHEEDQEVWCCLDLSARRWYTFDEDDRNIGPFVSGIQSMDGGLVCRWRLAHAQQHHSIIFHNVNGLTKVTLPEIARHLNSPDDPKLLMVADSTSFKIFLINHNFNTATEILDDPLLTSEERLKVQYDPLIHVYDSATFEWKSMVNTSWIEHGGLGYIRSIVMHQGFLYVLFLGYNSEGDVSSIWRLQRYNLAGGSWESLDVCTYSFITSSLVVSNDCLFLVLWCREEGSESDMSEECSFEVREISTRDMTQETVLKLSGADMWRSFDIKTGSPFGIRPFMRRFELLGFSVIGFESSLLIMSQESGKSKIFDLVIRSWDHGLPSNPLGQVHKKDSSAWIGKHMNLLLPWNTDW